MMECTNDALFLKRANGEIHFIGLQFIRVAKHLYKGEEEMLKNRYKLLFHIVITSCSSF